MSNTKAGHVRVLRVPARCPIPAGMSATPNNIDYELLRKLVQEKLPNHKSARSVSMQATDKRNPDLVRNLLEGTDSAFPSVFSLCNVLDIPLASVLKGVQIAERPAREWLTVNGEVEAGLFRPHPEWSGDDWYQVEVEYLDSGRPHHGLVVRGNSMEKRLPPGTILRCEDMIGSDLIFRDGDYVIVEKNIGGLFELTCKRLSQRQDGAWELIAESDRPEFRDPIYIGRPIENSDGPGFDGLTDDEVRVKAIVVDAYLPLARRRNRPMPE